jgi:aldehyde dehydrogenase (NAD+)
MAQATLQRFAMTIAGVAATTEAWLDVIDPATEKPWAQVPCATADNVDHAVSAAAAAVDPWAALTIDKRRAALEAFLDAVASRADEFAHILHHERGGPLRAGLGEVRIAVRFSRTLLQQYPALPAVRNDADVTVIRHLRPWGVVAAIAPWNFPLQLVLVKLIPALLCGNAIIIKPSPLTPATACLLGDIARDHLPAGLVNVLTGTDALGPLLTAHPGIAKISFTGSTATGRRVLAAAAATLKRVTLELGGNDAAIVMADADPIAAADALGWLAFANNGQICLAVKRIYVHQTLHDEFCDRLARVANAVRVGRGSDEIIDNGPLQNAPQHERVQDLLADAVRQGGRILAGGSVPVEPGYFLRPTVVTDTGDAMRLVHEEQFGPVIPVLRFSDIDDAVRRANNSEFGLGSSLWSSDLAGARAVSRLLQAGVTWINQHGFPDPRMPLAGAKQSGIGVEFGTWGVSEFLRLQVESIATATTAWFAPNDRSPSIAGAIAGQRFVNRVTAAAGPAGDSIAVVDPASGEIFARCAAHDSGDIDRAIARADAAGAQWRQLGSDARHDKLHAMADGLVAHREEIAWLLVREQGKPLFRARGEVDLAAHFVRSIADQAPDALADQTIRLDGGSVGHLVYEPLGVTAAIAPWNAPIALGLAKVATALAAGNSVVLKPSPNTPLATLRAIELTASCLPPSVIEVVIGGSDVGAALVTHPLVRKVSFTGSTETGKEIARRTAPQLKRLTLELGGNDAAIILDDVDVVAVAQRVAAAAFGNSGQICAAIKRIYVARPIHDVFVGHLVDAARAFRVGSGLNSATELGPLQNAAQFARVVTLWEAAVENGGRSLCGGPQSGIGYFFDPSVVVDVAEGCRLVDEEQFGPVVPVMAFDDIAEVIERANSSRFGLGGSVWSTNLELARAIASRLEVGTIWINQHGRFDASVPMPMIKESGVGVDYGEYGLRGQTQLHAFMGWDEPGDE